MKSSQFTKVPERKGHIARTRTAGLAAALLFLVCTHSSIRPFANLVPSAHAAPVASASSRRGLKVVVITPGRNWKLAASVAEDVSRKLVKKGKLLSSPAASAVPDTDSDYRAFRAAGRQGIRLYKSGSSGKAVRHFKRAIRRAEMILLRYGPNLEMIKKFVRAHYYLGACHLAEANPSDAAEAFRIAASFDPWGLPSRRRFSVEVIRAFRSAKAQAASRQGMLIVRTNRPARVFVDGHDRGIAPKSIKNLPRGRHFVVLHRLGYLRAAKFIDLDGPAATWQVNVSQNPRTPEMQPLLSALDRELRRKKRPGRYLKRLAAKLGAAQLVLCRASVDEAEVSWYDVNKNRFTKRVRRAAPVPGKAPSIQLADALMVKRPVFDLKESVVVRCLTDADCPAGKCVRGRCEPTKPIYKRWWFWVALGVSVAAAATAGAVIGTMPDRPIIRITTPR